MRVNVYAEEMTDRVEIISKSIDGHEFTGLRLYLELPVSVPGDLVQPHAVGLPYLESTSDPHVTRVVFGKDVRENNPGSTQRSPAVNLQGPFMHRPGDDDSSAVTFWGKRDLRGVLRKMLAALDAHYGDDT